LGRVQCWASKLVCPHSALTHVHNSILAYCLAAFNTAAYARWGRMHIFNVSLRQDRTYSGSLYIFEGETGPRVAQALHGAVTMLYMSRLYPSTYFTLW